MSFNRASVFCQDYVPTSYQIMIMSSESARQASGGAILAGLSHVVGLLQPVAHLSEPNRDTKHAN